MARFPAQLKEAPDFSGEIGSRENSFLTVAEQRHMIVSEPSVRFDSRTRFFSLQIEFWEPPLAVGMCTPARVGKPDAANSVAPPLRK